MSRLCVGTTAREGVACQHVAHGPLRSLPTARPGPPARRQALTHDERKEGQHEEANTEHWEAVPSDLLLLHAEVAPSCGRLPEDLAVRRRCGRPTALDAEVVQGVGEGGEGECGADKVHDPEGILWCLLVGVDVRFCYLGSCEAVRAVTGEQVVRGCHGCYGLPALLLLLLLAAAGEEGKGAKLRATASTGVTRGEGRLPLVSKDTQSGEIGSAEKH